MGPFRHLFLLMLLLLGACSARDAIDAVTPEADRAFAQDMVFRLHRGDPAWLLRHFTPALWAQSNAQLVAAGSLFPGDAGTTRLIGYHSSSSTAAGRTERSKEFTLVTHGGGRWTVTRFRTYSHGGPDLVVAWSVTPHSSVPPELAMIDAWDRMLPWVWAGLAFVLIGGGGLILWLIRRSRRVHDPWASGNVGRP